MSYLDWPAMIILIGAYVILARQPRGGTLLIAISDALWLLFAIATWQLPLVIVSVVCGGFALYTFLKWRDPSLKPEAR